ncbi:MAG: type II toxin-antitoxin system prevent-host-death family antitoxin [Roseiflexaceae bacterium]|nr:type II toxin-antitoxin system prevent-host-death family antitoxin [Roseiflexaceae bacterium]
MNAMTAREAQQNLERLITRVVADAEPTIVVNETGDRVVLVPLDEYNSWKETLYLLAHPANAAHLHASISEAQLGQAREQELLDV